MADSTFQAALEDLKGEVSKLMHAAGGAQPQLASRVAQKLAIVDACGAELTGRKDGPAGQVNARPLAHRLFVHRSLQALLADGLVKGPFSTGGWPSRALAIGMRLGVQIPGAAGALTADKMIQCFSCISMNIIFPNSGGSLFGDGQTDAFVTWQQLSSPQCEISFPFIRSVQKLDEWAFKFINDANGIASVVPKVAIEYIDLTQLGL